MFGNSPTYEPLHTGKKIQARKQSEFSLGWGNTTNQLNHVQARKSKNFEVTGKVTQAVMPQRQAVLKPVNLYQQQNQANLQSPQSKWLQYERLLRLYPDVPAQEIEKIVMGYSQPKPAQVKKGGQQNIQKPVSSYRPNVESQRRIPIRPKESMKDIIYGGQIGSENQNPRRANSRRNNTNLILGDVNSFKKAY